MITATWRIECITYCPYCERGIDLLDIQDSFEWMPKPGESTEIEVEIECPGCNREFTVQKTEY